MAARAAEAIEVTMARWWVAVAVVRSDARPP